MKKASGDREDPVKSLHLLCFISFLSQNASHFVIVGRRGWK